MCDGELLLQTTRMYECFTSVCLSKLPHCWYVCCFSQLKLSPKLTLFIAGCLTLKINNGNARSWSVKMASSSTSHSPGGPSLPRLKWGFKPWFARQDDTDNLLGVLPCTVVITVGKPQLSYYCFMRCFHNLPCLHYMWKHGTLRVLAQGGWSRL